MNRDGVRRNDDYSTQETGTEEMTKAIPLGVKARGTSLHTGAWLLQATDPGMAPGLPARPHSTRLPCRGPVGRSPEQLQDQLQTAHLTAGRGGMGTAALAPGEAFAPGLARGPHARVGR